MTLSLAPLEGITGFIVRNAFAQNFGGIDHFYTPFIPAAKRMNKKILRDIDPENNKGIHLIPQALANQPEEVLDLARQLEAYGYRELNLNIGCPSGTVSSKKRGSGLLSDLELLDRFLDGIYQKATIPISVKTRIGYASQEEWPAILALYRKYPISELIIHPRTRMDFYTGSPRLDTFAQAVNSYQTGNSQTRLTYNGDITSLSSYARMQELFPSVDSFMIGRGLLSHPGLCLAISQQAPLDQADYLIRLRAFHDQIYSGFQELFGSSKDAMIHMKEIWFYLGNRFLDSQDYVKAIKKAETCSAYKIAVNALFSSCPLNPLQ